MFKNTFAHFSMLSFTNGLSLDSMPDQEVTNSLAEIVSDDLHHFPELQLVNEDETCKFWAMFEGWGF